MNGHFIYQFEWDPIKAHENKNKHGVSFERSATVFSDPGALSLFDKSHSVSEERWITMGIDQNGILLVVCHTYRYRNQSGAIVRIISARKATKRETSQYEGK